MLGKVIYWIATEYSVKRYVHCTLEDEQHSDDLLQCFINVIEQTFKLRIFQESCEKPNEIQSRRKKIVCIKPIIERVNELAKSMKMTIQINLVSKSRGFSLPWNKMQFTYFNWMKWIWAQKWFQIENNSSMSVTCHNFFNSETK